MGYPTYPFVDRGNNPFTQLNSTPQIILEATSNTLEVNSINIVNKTSDDIRINLTKQTNSGSPVENFLAYNLLIPSYRTADSSKNYFNSMELVKKLGLEITLLYTPSLSQKLLCYSNGKSQYFDCEINYIIFNELPSS